MGDKPGRRLLLAGMTLANAMVLVDQTAVPLTLPSILRQFAISDVQVQWVLNASLLPLAALLVFGGKLGDLMGRRRVFLAGTVLFAVASALGGLAPSFVVLLVFRILQGAGGALMLPNTVAIVSCSFPGSERGRVLGTMGGAAAVAGALGPTIGGLLTSALSWRAVLLVNVPLAVVTVYLTVRTVPKDEPGSGKVRVDVPGALALGVMLASLVFGLAQSQAWGWTSPLVAGALVLCVLSAVAFVLIERAAPQPLLSFALLRQHPNYLAATISQVVGGMPEMGLALLFPLLLILNLQLPPGRRPGAAPGDGADGRGGAPGRPLVRPGWRALAAGYRIRRAGGRGRAARGRGAQQRVPAGPAWPAGLRRRPGARPHHQRPGEPRHDC